MQSDFKEITAEKNICYHCGSECISEINYEEKVFCCTGCESVYKLLSGNNLCSYYTLEEHPGINLKESAVGIKFNYLDDYSIQQKLIEFSNEEITKVSFYIPLIHCSSCIYLLEHLYKLDTSILSSRTDFTQKKIFITYKTNETTLKKIVTLLYNIGYEPEISGDFTKKNSSQTALKKLYYKIGIAGFCFGNIMLLSFPEYLSLGALDAQYKYIFGYLNILLTLPVFFYSASDYFKSALLGLKQKNINLDFPISLGISVIFLRSVFEVISGYGSGYFDSLTGLIFFLIIGKLIQTRTFGFINFERNYKSYFPVSVSLIKDETETTIPIDKLAIGDRILIRNGELVPADSILFNGNANIDYSFVTGESIPSQKVSGEIVYAGGRQKGDCIEVEVIRKVSQSYLTGLWNNEAFKKSQNAKIKLNDVIAKYFTVITLITAASAGMYWLNKDISIAINVFTAVLIIACPCALALAGPFALANTMRIFGKNKFYLKNTNTVEKLSEIDTVVFDKTGTITQLKNRELHYYGKELSKSELIEIKSITKNSTHPISREIYNSIKSDISKEVKNYIEITGAGIKGISGTNEYKIGSAQFIVGEECRNTSRNILINNSSKAHLSKNSEYMGYFLITNSFRNGLNNLVVALKKDKKIFLLSGDNDRERENLKTIFGNDTQMKFSQKPEEKLMFIKNLQKGKRTVLMIGDGLNDAGAIKQSDTGIAVTENSSYFSPACDAILDAENFSKLDLFLKYSGTTMNIIKSCFVFSMIYNFIGLFFAVQGTLSPLIAAVLMPLSSISVVLLAIFLTDFYAKKLKLI